MYCDAFQFYFNLLKNTNLLDGIVFCENSGFDLEKMKFFFPGLSELKNIEFISLSPNLFDIEKGKGYNEQLMIDLAFKQSQLLSQECHVFKVTGRYPIFNAKKLIGDVCKRGDGVQLFCDQRDHSLYDWLGIKKQGHYGETRFYCVSKEFYMMNFYGHYRELHSGRTSEMLMFEIAQKNYSNKNCFFRFPREARINMPSTIPLTFLGFSVPPAKQKSFFKGYFLFADMIRFLFPWFWF